VATLAAILLAILGASGPELVVRGSSAVTIIVDRGISMSPRDRRAEVLAQAKRVLPPDATLHFICVPPADLRDFAAANDAPPTCLNTSSMLQQAVADALDKTTGPILVLTDQTIRDHPQLLRVVPTKGVSNVGIVRFAIREAPTTQAMVTVRNDSDLARAELSVDGVRQTIDLPSGAQERNYFVDLPAAGRSAQAKIATNDDFDGDNTAFAARQRAWPRIEMRGDILTHIRRVVEAYARARPPADLSAALAIVRTPELLADDERGVIAVQSATTIPGPPTFAAHPITANLDASRWIGLRSGAAPAGPGWTTVIRSGDLPLVSVRETPVRQVWVSFASAELSRTSDFVVLWTNILNWVSEAGGEQFAASEVGDAPPEFRPLSGPELWPGIYRRADGALLAVHAPPVRFVSPAPSEARDDALRQRLAALAAEPTRGSTLAPYLLFAAAAAMLLAAMAWPREILTVFSPPRTV
jgi:hypothetical protein